MYLDYIQAEQVADVNDGLRTDTIENDGCFLDRLQLPYAMSYSIIRASFTVAVLLR